jgi:hypothetical protein
MELTEAQLIVSLHVRFLEKHGDVRTAEAIKLLVKERERNDAESTDREAGVDKKVGECAVCKSSWYEEQTKCECGSTAFYGAWTPVGRPGV